VGRGLHGTFARSWLACVDPTLSAEPSNYRASFWANTAPRIARSVDLLFTRPWYDGRMNALIAVVLVLLGTGMGPDAAIFLWPALAALEWVADRYASWLFKQLCPATPAMVPGIAA